MTENGQVCDLARKKKPLWQKYIILIQVLQHEPEYRNSWSSSRASGTFSLNQFADVDSDPDPCGSSAGSVSLYRIRIRNFTLLNGSESGSDLSPWNI
jgi:hypothetical protein